VGQTIFLYGGIFAHLSPNPRAERLVGAFFLVIVVLRGMGVPHYAPPVSCLFLPHFFGAHLPLPRLRPTYAPPGIWVGVGA
jgi:hypothetical protein